MVTICIALASLCGAFGLAAAPASAAAPARPVATPAARTASWQAAIGRLFDAGSSANSASVAAVRAQYERLKRAAPNDRRIDYAFGVLLINQHRYSEAETLIARYMQAGPSEPHVHCTEIWTLMQLHRYADAAGRAVALAGQFPAGAAAAPQPKFHEAAEFLGTAYGYLELARTPQTEIVGLSQSKERVLEALGETYLEAFDAGRDGVATRLAEMKTRLQAEENQRLAKTEEEKKLAQADLEKDSSQIASHADAIESSAEQLQEAQRQFDQIQRELGSLSQDRTQLGARIITIQAQISALSSPQVNDQRVANGTGRTTVSTRQLGPNDPRFVQMQYLATQLAVLNKQAFDMDRKILAYRQQATALGFKGMSEAEMIARRQEATAVAERHAQVAERALKRSEKASNPRSAALNEKMKHLSTHAPFPFAQEKSACWPGLPSSAHRQARGLKRRAFRRLGCQLGIGHNGPRRWRCGAGSPAISLT